MNVQNLQIEGKTYKVWWLYDPSQMKGDNPNNKRHEDSGHLRSKKK
jgi:hypothetical protein